MIWPPAYFLVDPAWTVAAMPSWPRTWNSGLADSTSTIRRRSGRTPLACVPVSAAMPDCRTKSARDRRPRYRRQLAARAHGGRGRPERPEAGSRRLCGGGERMPAKAGRPVRLDDLEVHQQLPGVLEHHHAVAQQAPALQRVPGDDPGRRVAGGLRGRTPRLVLAHAPALPVR